MSFSIILPLGRGELEQGQRVIILVMLLIVISPKAVWCERSEFNFGPVPTLCSSTF
jgi:hypothetical protein